MDEPNRVDNPTHTENRPTATEKYARGLFHVHLHVNTCPEPEREASLNTSLVPSPHSTAIHVQVRPWHGCVSYVMGGM